MSKENFVTRFALLTCGLDTPSQQPLGLLDHRIYLFMVNLFRSLFAPPRDLLLLVAALWIGLALA
ncbi:MAG: hypothetical protein IT314_17905, partial [Anaerolineales bacterium]|nr:hypothetical protein [Anaerolineales bacterium]